MRKYSWIFSFVLSAAIITIGCEKQETTPVDTTAAPSGAASPSTPVTPPDTSVTGAPLTTPDQTPTTSAVGAATEAAGANAAAATGEAQKLLDQAMTYIKENKLDLADKTLTQLEGMKASLPEAFQTKIADARSLLNTAKTAGGAKLPALPGAQ